MATYRLFPSTSGPASSVTFGNIVQGILFEVTSLGMVLSGYWYWRSDSGQSASASFALWRPTGFGTGTLVANSTAATSSMVVGQWNYVPLTTPLALTSGVAYKAVVGTTANFNDTANSFNAGGPYVNGIVNGPLTGFSAFAGGGGTRPDPFGNYQCSYDTSSADPTAVYPANDSSSYNAWIDVQVADTNAVYALQQFVFHNSATGTEECVIQGARRDLVSSRAVLQTPASFWSSSPLAAGTQTNPELAAYLLAYPNT